MNRFFHSLILCSLISNTAFAFSWEDLWKRPDQQGIELLSKGNATEAAKRFEDKNWQGVAQYRSGQYKQANDNFSQLKSADGYYNQGNALAHMGKYQEATKAYDQTLALQSNHEDAEHNREVVKKLLEQQNENQDSNENQEQNQNSNQDQQQSQPNENQDNQSDKEKDNQSNPDNSEQQENKDQNDQTKQNKNQNTDQQKVSEANQDKTDQSPSPDQQKLQQWLQQIPDDPGGLMRQKFRRDYLNSIRNKTADKSRK